MAPDSDAPAKRSLADQEYLHGLSIRQVMTFRNFVFTPAYIAANQGKFLDYDWVDISALRQFLAQASAPDTLAAPPPTASGSSRVKLEPRIMKLEPQLFELQDTLKMRTLEENGREVIDLVSDSESEVDGRDLDLEVMDFLRPGSRSSSVIPFSAFSDPDGAGVDSERHDSTKPPHRHQSGSTSTGSDTTTLSSKGSDATTLSDAYRFDSEEPTASSDDLSDKRYWYRDPANQELISLVAIIHDSDNNSWDWGGGGPNTSANIIFAAGEQPIDCKRVGETCKGVHACNQLNPALRNVVREGNTPEELVALFMKVLRNTKCHAVDSKNNKCKGGPILKPHVYGPSHGHHYFVGCSGYRSNWTDGHRLLKIPDHVNEDLLAKALSGVPLSENSAKDTPPCTAIVHPRTWLKKKDCAHAHIFNGTPVVGKIQRYTCKATRYIYVPKDTSIRKVLILNALTPHNHPMPMLIKPTFEVKEMYREIIAANGVLGATAPLFSALIIPTGPSTKLLLNGKTPAAHAPALHSKRLKQEILHAAKLQEYPNGLGVEGELIIVTFVPALLRLLDDPGVTSFDGDTTFKGVEGKVNEWELTIFAKDVQRAASILRAYINGASADFFELLFDELQRQKLMVTGKPLPLKTFVRGGNILVTNFDMDTAQVIGLCRAVMKPVHDFRSLVSTDHFNRLMNFAYIDSKESLDEFSTFVYGLKVKKMTAWWKHKEMHEWIIPCIVKSQSRLSADVWDSTPSTTNTNEAQHHWTNTQTGIRLPPVEALERVDTNFAEEIKISERTGILSNPNNEMSHRMSRNSQRQSATARKALESRTAADASAELQLQIDAEAEKSRISKETMKALKAQLKAEKGKAGKGRKSGEILSASSSGRGKTTQGNTGALSVIATQTPPVEQSALESPPIEPPAQESTSLDVGIPPQTAPNEPTLDPTLEYIRNFDFSSAMAGAENSFTPPHASSSASVSHSASFSVGASNFNGLLPGAGSAIPMHVSYTPNKAKSPHMGKDFLKVVKSVVEKGPEDSLSFCWGEKGD
ncbi:hypothetical protein B0H16DRAFT_1482466 [Mycena metata]|uniref:Uncharacterized protein n=1 Tax=Mycena metata TaxID=1033252 RepID=A0AAD7GTM3_9AGAR|nr:hypothetical protein B0H16DRAFT_1482466 [Mycena metata]